MSAGMLFGLDLPLRGNIPASLFFKEHKDECNCEEIVVVREGGRIKVRLNGVSFLTCVR